MIRRTLFYLLLCVGSGILIVGCSRDLESTSSDGRTNQAQPNEKVKKVDETVEASKAESNKHPGTASPPSSSEWEPPKTFVGEFPFPPQPPSPVESRESTKEERIRDLYDSLTEADWEGLDRFVPHPKDVEIRVEGMDAFTAAKYLQSHGLYQHYANEYAKRAVAENPGNFEILLFYTKTLDPDQMDEREATYRQLYEMAPDSIDVLYGLGSVLSIRKPDEAVVHLEKLVAMDPSDSSAYGPLGVSYRANSDDGMRR